MFHGHFKLVNTSLFIFTNRYSRYSLVHPIFTLSLFEATETCKKLIDCQVQPLKTFCGVWAFSIDLYVQCFDPYSTENATIPPLRCHKNLIETERSTIIQIRFFFKIQQLFLIKFALSYFCMYIAQDSKAWYAISLYSYKWPYKTNWQLTQFERRPSRP